TRVRGFGDRARRPLAYSPGCPQLRANGRRNVRAGREHMFAAARRTLNEFNQARDLLESGVGIRATARALGLPYNTVRYWRGLTRPPNTMVKRVQAWPGRKHTRKIELVDWQRELTHRHPEALIRGLIHSDGSRVINGFK